MASPAPASRNRARHLPHQAKLKNPFLEGQVERGIRHGGGDKTLVGGREAARVGKDIRTGNYKGYAYVHAPAGEQPMIGTLDASFLGC
jgi:hypothetical protein